MSFLSRFPGSLGKCLLFFYFLAVDQTGILPKQQAARHEISRWRLSS